MLQALLTGVLGGIACFSFAFVALAAVDVPFPLCVATAGVCAAFGFCKASLVAISDAD